MKQLIRKTPGNIRKEPHSWHLKSSLVLLVRITPLFALSNLPLTVPGALKALSGRETEAPDPEGEY